MLIEGTYPNHDKPFLIPKIHEEILKTKINILIKMGGGNKKTRVGSSYRYNPKRIEQFVSFPILNNE